MITTMKRNFTTFIFVILFTSGCWILWMFAYRAKEYIYDSESELLEEQHEDNFTSDGIAPPTEKQPQKIILFWNTFSKFQGFAFGLGHAPFVKHSCTIDSCVTTKDRSLLPKADAVIFHVRGLKEQSKDELPRHAHARQLFIFFTFESPMHTYHNLTAFNDYFNLTFSYREDSDIYCPLGKVIRRPAFKTMKNMDETLSKIYSTKSKMVAWVISHCDKEGSMRWQYGKELAKHVPVDIWGSCGTFSCPKTARFPQKCFALISRKYRFYLGFENSVCRDYITEKLWRTLQYDLVPVVLGGANYSHYLPPKSYIDVRDFSSPKHLAHYLRYLGNNPVEYLDYFRWKERLQVSSGLRPAGFCKLCEMLQTPEKYTYKNEFDLYKWWEVDGNCIEGEQLAKTLGLSPDTRGP